MHWTYHINSKRLKNLQRKVHFSTHFRCSFFDHSGQPISQFANKMALSKSTTSLFSVSLQGAKPTHAKSATKPASPRPLVRRSF
jgi:hypothetical protein